MVSARKHANNVVEARYVSTIAIGDFAENATGSLFAAMVFRSLDARYASKAPVVRVSKYKLSLH
jgi:hypothetical protein